MFSAKKRIIIRVQKMYADKDENGSTVASVAVFLGVRNASFQKGVASEGVAFLRDAPILQANGSNLTSKLLYSC